VEALAVELEHSDQAQNLHAARREIAPPTHSGSLKTVAISLWSSDAATAGV